ncbi:autotransporter-associated beta strand repeat-containing protein [Luteolibacter yonseiensis]|uniref:Autotransporter-associated beta strand repeat-containing protein n=1 Tax=Luteolibacter yonseiensis TaxID=1144680 RepID=A0A934R8T4_9BACT|nr:autotransporter-associated beta strand repeat-containing protein [Luteolibacter yonseiensis]MBK1817174.1 autotransporter-associated beta strand repeat-containing protein [Luteolibacter yonseiensis]
MKPTRSIFSRPDSSAFPVVAVLSVTLACASHSSAADLVWTTNATGDFTDASKYVSATAPAATGDTVVANGAYAINYVAGNTHQLASLTLNGSSGGGAFNQSGGDLTLGTLWLGRTSGDAGGASRIPNYNLTGGTVSAGAINWGNGSNSPGVRISVSAGTFGFTGTSMSMGGSTSGSSNINMTGGTFDAGSATTLYLGNGGTGKGTINLAGTSEFNAPAATLVLGQSGNSGSLGTLTLADNSKITTSTVVLGGANASFATNGVINLNGGTLATGSIRRGASSLATGTTALVLHANGGTVKALAHGNNGDFFLGTYVDLVSGGLKFDTGENYIAISNALSGSGGLTKLGPGYLSLGSNSLTYTGDTVVTEGTLTFTNGTLPDTANVSIAGGDVAKLDLAHGIEDAIGTLTLGGVVKPNGVYGSSSSSAPFENQDDTYFSGAGTVRVGPPTAAPRNLAWDGSYNQIWSNFADDTNFLEGSTLVAFKPFDNVTFGNVANPDEFTNLRSVYISTAVQPTSITFNNDTGFDYTISGGSIGGTTGIVKNGTGSVTLGSSASSFLGPIIVNGGRLILGQNKGFGNTSGITIANLAQVDINGRTPGVNHAYTLGGTGPDGTGQIVNSGADVVGAGGVGPVTLTGNTTIGNDGQRFDIGSGGGILTGNSHTLTKVGNNNMAFRGNASGSPIHIVAAGGNIWAEGTDAFGGTTGTLTAKTGTRVGTYGTRSVTTPATLESGSGINNLGNGKGTWSGPLSFAGNITIDSGGTANDQIDLTGPITGTADVTKNGTANVTVSHPSWSGNTTVNGGTLVLSNAELADSGSVSIAATAFLNLPHGLEDTVATFFINGTQMPAGVYGATGNLTAAFTTDRITGAGKLIVTSGPVAGAAYGTWADATITNPAYASLKGRQDDPDTDGFTNLQEFLFGGDPQANTGTLTSITQGGGNLVLRWVQRDSGATYQLLQSATLADNPWSPSAIVPVNSVDQTGLPGGHTRKEAAIPVDGDRKFLRVQGAEN